MGSRSVLTLLKGLPQTFLAWAWMGMVLLRSLTVRRRAPASRDMLIVAWGFPPLASVGVHVIASLAREAAREGWRVWVVCGPEPANVSAAGLELLQGLGPAVTIVRVRSRFMDDHGARLTTLPGMVPSLDGDYLTAWAMLNAALPELRQRMPAVVVGTGPRFSNFVAARWLADLCHCPLVLHYRDEWTVNTPEFVHPGEFERDVERDCLQRADLVLFASQPKLTAYRKAFPDVAPGKLAVMMNGWDPHFHSIPIPPANAADKLIDRDRFALLYAGRWHGSLQPLIDNFDALLRQHPEMVDRLQLVLVGNQTETNSRLLADFQASWPGCVRVSPQVCLSEAVALMRMASALLLINDHVYDGVIPQKTYDYMATGRPILVYGEAGGATAIVLNVQAGLCVGVTDMPALHAALTSFMAVASDHWNSEKRLVWVEANNRSRLIQSALVQIQALTQLPRYQPAAGKEATAG